MKKNKSVKKYTQFLNMNGDYVPTTDVKTLDSIEPGAYEIFKNIGGEIVFSAKDVVFDSYVELKSMEVSKVIQEIKTFWSQKIRDKYTKLGVTYKRGIMLYGPPGTGKTTAVFNIMNHVVEMGGIAVYNPEPNLFSKAVKALRDIQPNTPVVCIFEEFDKYCKHADFLSLLDGEIQVDNVVYIATTNYIDAIPDNLKRRPSRFAKVLEIGKPDADARRTYIETKVPDISRKELKELVSKTDGMVIDQVKEVIISAYCFGDEQDGVLKTIKNLSKKAFGLAREGEEYKNTLALPTFSFGSMLKEVYEGEKDE